MNGDQLDAIRREEYAKSPALTSFSKVPITYERAQQAGINSYARAHRVALDKIRAAHEEAAK